MRIGVFTYDYDPPIGGLGVVVQQSVSALRKHVPEDEYFIFSPSPLSPHYPSRLASLWWGKLGGCPLFSCVLNVLLPRIIKRSALDLVHVHAGSGGVFLLRKLSVPLVVTAHHTYAQEAQFVYAMRPIKTCWKRFMGMFERRTYEMADRILCVSADTMQALIHDYGIAKEKLEVVENAVDVPPDERRKERESNTIVYVGRLEARKGIWTLLRAFALLRKRFPRLSLRLVGENLLGSALARFLDQARMSASVAVTGHVTPSLKEREISEATMIVVPSLLEGFGLVALESMALGTCVIASDGPGLRSIVEDRKTGLLFRSGDPEDCARAIEHALTHPSDRTEWERAALKTARVRFSPEKQARAIAQIYRTCIEKERPSTIV